VVTTVLPRLADSAGIDWSLPLNSWSKEVMTSFLMTAWKLIGEAETARDHGSGKILCASKSPPDWEKGDKVDDIPFGL
jgi:hypothetical protein